MCAVALFSFILLSCIPNAAIKRGDAAAARGDWRSAEAQYRQALEREPSNVELSTKYGNAKSKAVDAAVRAAEVCRTTSDGECVERELSFALSLDPAHARAATLRAQSRQSAVLQALANAKRFLDERDPASVWREIAAVRSIANPEQLEVLARVDVEAASVADELARVMVANAAALSPTEALALLDAAQSLSDEAAARNSRFGTTARLIRAVRQERVDARVSTLRSEGATALTSEDYAGAARAYTAAYATSRADADQSRAHYASSMHSAHGAQAQRAFENASAHLRAAIATGLDQGRARALLELIEPRVYRVRLESVAITPTRPGTTQPWVGKSWLAKAIPAAVGAAVTFKAGAKAGALAHDVAAAVAAVHPENRPLLYALIDLPDGRRLATKKVKGTYVIYGAEFYIVTNKLDAQTVRVALFHERRGGDESIAVSNVPLGQIVAGQIDRSAVSGDTNALQEMVFAAELGEPWQDGKVTEATILDGNENLASTRSMPSPSAVRAQLISIAASAPEEGGDGDGSHPDPYVEIYEGTRQILKTSTAQDTRANEWSFASSDLFLRADDQFTVKLVDADFSSDDHIASWQVPAKQLMTGSVRLTTVRGTTLLIRTGSRARSPR